MYLEIVLPVASAMLVVLGGGLIRKHWRRRRARTQAACTALVPAAPLQAIDFIKASLEDIYQQLDRAPVEDSGARRTSAVLALDRYGVSASEIAQHLRMSGDEADLMIQVHRRRARWEA